MKLYLEYAKNNNIDIEGLSDNQIIDKIEEISSEVHLKELYPEGSVIKISGCDGCDTFSYGSPRCSCGNVRISMTVDGSLEEGYFSYPETC